MKEVANINIDDGFEFGEIKIGTIPHPHMKYPGTRINMLGRFGKIRFKVSIDLGYGDLVDSISMPLPLMSSKKGALFESHVEISCYPIEFIFAEKLHTTIVRAGTNSRMKDFHDLYLMIGQKGDKLAENIENVIRMVFEHRQTKLTLPISFSEKELTDLQSYWTRHLRGLKKNHNMPQKLCEIINTINDWLSTI
jgi:hypothetical protein